MGFLLIPSRVIHRFWINHLIVFKLFLKKFFLWSSNMIFLNRETLHPLLKTDESHVLTVILNKDCPSKGCSKGHWFQLKTLSFISKLKIDTFNTGKLSTVESFLWWSQSTFVSLFSFFWKKLIYSCLLVEDLHLTLVYQIKSSKIWFHN